MIKSYNQIYREVADAVEYVRSEGGAVADNTVAEQSEFGRQDYELSDNDVIDCEEDLPAPAPNVVRVATLDELFMVYNALGRVHRCPIKQQMIDEDISHERRHKEAADQIGFRHSVYETRITVSRETLTPYGGRIGEIGWRPLVRQAGSIGRITKLASASIIAAPASLSEGDLARLQAMGYEGQEDVANRIVTATDPRLSTLPLPDHFRR
jgi:hypothetical protein